MNMSSLAGSRSRRGSEVVQRSEFAEQVRFGCLHEAFEWVQVGGRGGERTSRRSFPHSAANKHPFGASDGNGSAGLTIGNLTGGGTFKNRLCSGVTSVSGREVRRA